MSTSSLPAKRPLLWGTILTLLVLTRIIDSYTPKPTYADYYVDIGRSYEQKGDLKKALHCYEQGIFHNPQSIYPFYYAALLYGHLGDKKKEIEYLYKVAEIGPDTKKMKELTRLINVSADEEYSGAVMLIGEDLFLQKRYTDALFYLNRSIQYYGGQKMAYYYLTLSYFHLHDYSKMKQTLKRISDSQMVDIFEKISTIISPPGGEPLPYAQLKKLDFDLYFPKTSHSPQP